MSFKRSLALAATLPLSAPGHGKMNPTEVGFVTSGPIGRSLAWSLPARPGSPGHGKNTFGDKVQTTYVETSTREPMPKRTIRVWPRPATSVILPPHSAS